MAAAADVMVTVLSFPVHICVLRVCVCECVVCVVCVFERKKEG